MCVCLFVRVCACLYVCVYAFKGWIYIYIYIYTMYMLLQSTDWTAKGLDAQMLSSSTEQNSVGTIIIVGVCCLQTSQKCLAITRHQTVITPYHTLSPTLHTHSIPYTESGVPLYRESQLSCQTTETFPHTQTQLLYYIESYQMGERESPHKGCLISIDHTP